MQLCQLRNCVSQSVCSLRGAVNATMGKQRTKKPQPRTLICLKPPVETKKSEVFSHFLHLTS